MVMKPYYEHAGQTIFHGDCREILPGLPKCDLLLTDPPYGAGYAANPILGKNRASAPHDRKELDGQPVAEMSEIIEVRQVCDCLGRQLLRASAVGAAGSIWYKPDSLPSMADLEMAWVSRDGNAKHFSWTTAATNPERVGHPTQKPEAVMKLVYLAIPAGVDHPRPLHGQRHHASSGKESRPQGNRHRDRGALL